MSETINTKAFRSLSYGLYIVSAKSGDKAAFDAAFKVMVDYRASVEADNVCAWAWFADMEEEVAGWPHATQGYRSK